MEGSIESDTWRTGTLAEFSDDRGCLVPVDLVEFEMEAQRFFWIHDVPPGATRAGHGHLRSRQVIFVVRGSVMIDLETPERAHHELVMGALDWLYLPVHHLLTMRDFAPGTVIGVLATEGYDPGEVIVATP